MREENIIGSGAKRTRRGTYKSVYLDNKGKGKRYWRGDICTQDAGGCIRLRKWFKNRKDAENWINGRTI